MSVKARARFRKASRKGLSESTGPKATAAKSSKDDIGEGKTKSSTDRRLDDSNEQGIKGKRKGTKASSSNDNTAVPDDEALAPKSVPEQGRGPPPAMGGDWEVIAVPNGWLRWSRKLGRCDAHCRVPDHNIDGECKMDRKVTPGTLGLSMLWMTEAHKHASHFDHALHKEIYSASESLPARETARSDFQGLCSSDDNVRRLFEMEKHWRRGEVIEPEMVPCRSLMREVK